MCYLSIQQWDFIHFDLSFSSRYVTTLRGAGMNSVFLLIALDRRWVLMLVLVYPPWMLRPIFNKEDDWCGHMKPKLEAIVKEYWRPSERVAAHLVPRPEGKWGRFGFTPPVWGGARWRRVPCLCHVSLFLGCHNSSHHLYRVITVLSFNSITWHWEV